MSRDTNIIMVDESLKIDKSWARPQEVRNFGSTFGSAEVEKSAARLVAFFAQSNRWRAFSFTELISFFQLKGWEVDEMLYGFTGAYFHPDPLSSAIYELEPMFIHVGDKLVPTAAFVKRCTRNVHMSA